MAVTYYAKIELTETAGNFNVSQVIAADQAFIDNQPGTWLLTDYNSYGNVHYASSPPAEPGTPDGLPALRANFASVNFTYDQTNDVFYAPQPFPDWVLNTTTWLWEAPITMPTETLPEGKYYAWDATTHNWVVK
jgi:hypothetical protein